MDKNGFLVDLSESEQTDFGRVVFAVQPEPQKVFSAIWELESQVNNGGFDQYFRNSDADIITYAPMALRAVSASWCAGIVDRAIAVIAPFPPTHAGRHAALDSASNEEQDRLAALDAEFLGYPDNLTEMLFEYIRERPGIFGPVPGA